MSVTIIKTDNGYRVAMGQGVSASVYHVTGQPGAWEITFEGRKSRIASIAYPLITKILDRHINQQGRR